MATINRIPQTLKPYLNDIERMAALKKTNYYKDGKLDKRYYNKLVTHELDDDDRILLESEMRDWFISDRNEKFHDKQAEENAKLHAMRVKKQQEGDKKKMEERIQRAKNDALVVKGTKATYADLDAVTDAEAGDVWNVTEAGTSASTPDHKYHSEGTNWVRRGSEWDALGGTVDLTNYVTTDVFIPTQNIPTQNYEENKEIIKETEKKTKELKDMNVGVKCDKRKEPDFDNLARMTPEQMRKIREERKKNKPNIFKKFGLGVKKLFIDLFFEEVEGNYEK